MSRARIFFVTAFVLIVARASDLVTTFHFNPSLSLEANPAVLILGGGNWSLIVMTLIFSPLAIVSLIVFWRGQSLMLHNPLPKSMTGLVRLWLNRVVFDRRPLTSYF